MIFDSEELFSRIREFAKLGKKYRIEGIKYRCATEHSQEIISICMFRRMNDSFVYNSNATKSNASHFDCLNLHNALSRALVYPSNTVYILLSLSSNTPKDILLAIREKRSHHSNLLIYRKTEKTIEWVEPLGNNYLDAKEDSFREDREIAKRTVEDFSEKNGIKFIFDMNHETIQKYGENEENEFGFCLMYCHMIAYLSAEFPTVSLKTLIHHILFLTNEHNEYVDCNNDYRLDLIRGFVEHVYGLVKEDMKQVCPNILNYLHRTRPCTDKHIHIQNQISEYIRAYKAEQRKKYTDWNKEYTDRTKQKLKQKKQQLAEMKRNKKLQNSKFKNALRPRPRVK